MICLFKYLNHLKFENSKSKYLLCFMNFGGQSIKHACLDISKVFFFPQISF